MQIHSARRRMGAGGRPRAHRGWSTAGAVLAMLGLSVTMAFAQAPREDLVAKLAGKKVRVDAVTKQLRAITADEARDFIAEVAKATDASLATRSEITTPAGSMARLDGHVGHIIVSRPNQDGSVALRCVGSADEAVAFLVEEGLPLQ
jgi:hypothetical protein